MRKIETQEQREKREGRNKLILSIVLIGIMALSTLGYSFFQADRGDTRIIKYDNIKFELMQDGFWHAIFNNVEYTFSYNPKETENITFKISAKLADYENQPLYFSNEGEIEGEQEIARNIEKFTSRTQRACIDEKCGVDLPVKKCTEDNIIIVKNSNDTSIRQEDRCIYIYGNSQEIVKASDAFLFYILK